MVYLFVKLVLMHVLIALEVQILVLHVLILELMLLYVNAHQVKVLSSIIGKFENGSSSCYDCSL